MSHPAPRRRSDSAGIALVILALAAGCGAAYHGPVAPGMNARRWVSLQTLSSRELGCPQAELVHRYLGAHEHEMSGCDAAGTYVLRCHFGNCRWVPDVRFVATGHLGCIHSSLEVRVLGPGKRRVTGCGKEATYVLIQNLSSLAGSSGWVLDNDSRDRLGL